MPVNALEPDSEDSLHLRFARDFIHEEGGLSQRVLRELVERPRRFDELLPLQRGHRDHHLAWTLSRLERDGLIERRTSKREVVVSHTFELTALGTGAHAALQAQRPIDALASLPRGRQRSGLREARSGGLQSEVASPKR